MKTPGHIFPVLMNTRWMFQFCMLRDARLTQYVQREIDLLDPGRLVQQVFDCPSTWTQASTSPGGGGSGISWWDYLEALEMDVNRSGRWFSGTWTGSPGIMDNPVVKLSECCLGYITVALEKLLMVQVMKTEMYEGFAHVAAESLHLLDSTVDRYKEMWKGRPADSLTVLLLTRWPALQFLCRISQRAQARNDDSSLGYQHKPYMLDFQAREIVGPPLDVDVPAQLRAVDPAAHRAAIRNSRTGRASATFHRLLAALDTTLAEDAAAAAPSSLKVLLVSLAWGARLAFYLPGALQRVSALGHAHRYLVFCLDESFCSACEELHPYPALCVPGRLKTIFNKYTMVSAVVRLGFDVLYLDFDTVLLQDPLLPILTAAERAEVLVSRDFGGECLNTGVIFFKAHRDVAACLSSLLQWLWHHPYEFSQKAFSAFLGHERVSLSRLNSAATPRWAMLDPTNAFVTSVVYNRGVEGWTGSLDDIVIYHFLDGTGGVDSSLAEAGRYVNLYELFYANPRLDLKDTTVPLWRQDPEVEKHLLSTRLPGPPQTLQPCSLLPEGDNDVD